MEALSIFPSAFASLPRHSCSPVVTHVSNPLFSPRISSIKLVSTSFDTRTSSLRGDRNSPSEFISKDENGGIDDMDGYMNHLSLEYDSVWDTKPAWCQPWTIALTGVSVIACSWVILHSVVVTSIVLSLICLWWYIFLYSYPKAYSDMIEERRKKVSSGIEDTFGQRRSQ